MHLSIRHDIRCRFAGPMRNIAAILRLAPRSHEGQHVADWRIDADFDCSLKAGQDGFGNLTHRFSAAGPMSELAITVAGEVDTFDTSGLVRGAPERLPREIFLRDTPSTAASPALRAFAERAVGSEVAALARLHALLEAIHGEIGFDEGATDWSAAGVFEAKSAPAPGHAHLFIACARHLSIPSRYAGGYLHRGEAAKGACHAWVEAHVGGLGWVAFDSVENLCPLGQHVRMACGLDAWDAALVRTAGVDQITHGLTIEART